VTGSDRRLGALCQLGGRIAAATSLEELVDVTLMGLDELLGHSHSLLLVNHLEADRLVTIASNGYGTGGIGSEVVLGEGVIGMAGKQRSSMRVGNLQRMLAYARSVQRASTGKNAGAESEIRLPGLADARSQAAAPMIARGALVGVLAIESDVALAFDDIDEQILVVVAQLAAAALDREELVAADSDAATAPASESAPGPAASFLNPAFDVPTTPCRLRYYVADGSVFIDDTYVIKGVAGRILWKVASEYVASGRCVFTNRETRLDPDLELPALRDNFESRLILLKRRLQERGAPLRITGAGRGRFEVRVDGTVALERVET